MDGATQYALAYALTTTAGLRGLLTLAAFSIFVHAGWMHVPQGFAWLGSTGVTIALVAVAIVDFAGDKVPALDHVLHLLHIVIKPACAAVLVGGTLHLHSTPELVALMGLGVLNALGIHAASATVRGTSTAFTAGVANPVISVCEDVLAAAMAIVAFVAPFAGVALALLLTIAIVILARRGWRHVRRRQAAMPR